MKTGRRRQITWLITIGIHRQMLQDIVSRILKNVEKNNFIIDFFHKEEACFSGRFIKKKVKEK